MDRRCVHLRQEASHQLTTELTGTYGEVVIEDLDIAAMKVAQQQNADLLSHLDPLPLWLRSIPGRPVGFIYQ